MLDLIKIPLTTKHMLYMLQTIKDSADNKVSSVNDVFGHWGGFDPLHAGNLKLLHWTMPDA